MIEFKATYYDGKRSGGLPVVVVYEGMTIYIQSEDGHAIISSPLKDCQISPPLGRTSRTIKIKNGAQCETLDLEAIEALEKYSGKKNFLSVVHALELRWKMVFACLLGLVLFVFLVSKFGVPWAAKNIAYSIPYTLMEEISQSTLEVLDKNFFEPSKLTLEKREQVEMLFAQLHKEMDSEFNYKIEFRKSPAIGANALALPAGTIVITDELIKLSGDDKELIAILAHEITHVKNRHGMRSVLQNTGIFLLVSGLVGDIASITSIAATLPTLLAQANYSRKFEREADRAAALYMLNKGWSTKSFQDILVRMSKNLPEFTGESILSTHPVTMKRVETLQELEDSYND